jgi:glucose/mannose-6-phosphate isomerase
LWLSTRIPVKRLLDDKHAVRALDKSNSFKDELDFPDNLRKAVKNAEAFKLPNKVKAGRKIIDYSEPISNIVFAGMGGSAIAGDLIRDWLDSEMRVPMESVRGYHLPAYVDEKTLVFLISYSGNTEETLSCMLDALDKGCRIVSISSNGALGRVSKALGLPIIGLPKMAAARVSFPYLFGPIPYFLARMNLLSTERFQAEMRQAITLLERLSKEYEIDVSFEDNFAKKAAFEIFGTVPVIYSYEPYRSVGLRFKTQVNENCKLPARSDAFPELNHNEIMGWEASTKILKHYTLILLRGNDEPKEVQTRIEVLKEKFFKKKAKHVIEICARQPSLLSRMLYLLFTADMISLYLSVLHRRDPVASQTFEILKYQVTQRLQTLEKLEQKILKLAT